MRLVEFARVQMGIRQHDAAVGGNYIHMIGFHLDLFRHLLRWHVSVPLQEPRQVTLMLRMKMCDDYESHAGIGGQGIKKRAQCCQATGRSTNSYNDHA